MDKWNTHRFSDFTDINPKTVLTTGNKYSFVEMKDLDESKKFCSPSRKRILTGGSRFENGDTLFARITPCLENGKICQVRNLEKGKGFGSTEFLVFRGKKEISHEDFIYYLSRWDEVRDFAEVNMTGSSGRQRVAKEVFDNLRLTLPPLPEQQAIASVLSSLDDKIDLLNHQNQTLEAMAETLFKEWFVVNAKEEWEEKSLHEIASFHNGKSRPKENGKIPVYGGNGVLGYTNEANFFNRSIIVGRVGAYCGSVYYESEPIWLSDNALLVRPKQEKSSHFLHYFLKLSDLNSMAEGSSHPLITQTLLKKISLKIPPKDRIEKFEIYIESQFQKILFNKKQIQTLTKLRDTLLPKLMSGEVRVI